MLEFDGWIDEFVECCQCGVVSRCEKAFRRHFKSIHLALVITDVSCEVCIFVALFCVSLFDVVLGGTCEYEVDESG